MEQKVDSDEVLGFIPYDREAYASGELHLNYAKMFSDGSLLRAEDDNEGVANVFIEKEGNVVFDFKELVPAETIFITPRARARNESFEPNRSAWYGDKRRGEVTIGDWRSPRDLLPFLHELGHINMDTLPDDTKPLTDEEKFSLRIKNEEQANDYALATIKKISDKLGLDLVRDIFGSEEEIKKMFAAIIENKNKRHKNN